MDSKVKNRKLGNRGMADQAIAIASTAIIIVVVVLVSAQLLATATSVSGSSTTSQAAYAIGNVSNYVYTGLPLLAVGLIVMAGMGLVGYLTMKR